MKSKRRSKRKKPVTDRKVLWPIDELTDKHNDWVCKQLADKNRKQRRD